MRVPLSWLTNFVNIKLSPEALAHKLTFAGLEVEDIEYVGLAPADRDIDGLPPQGRPKAKGLAWDREKIVVAQVLEVLPHPNADRLTLLRLDDGTGAEHTVLTGAPNLFAYKGTGPLPLPIKVAYAREGAVLIDGHKSGRELMTLKRAKIRGVESSSMACSEKELGISDDHEGVIVLDGDAPVGRPLADYMGDVVFTIALTPNMARNASVLGAAREIAALTRQRLKPPSYDVVARGPSIKGRLAIEIRRPDLNPRFSAMLINDVTIGPSPYWVQRRLRLAGMRPINNVVDATNYAMLELGEPLHAFDWDALVARAQGGRPTIITRLPEPGETLRTLDGVERKLDDFTILVSDRKGALSLGGVMGGAESEVSQGTRNVLLEAAAWDLYNIRRTVQSQRLQSEAAYRFSRGVHPAMAERGLRRGIELMRQWTGGTVARGVVDAYPKKARPVVVELSPSEVERVLGMKITSKEIIRILESLEFTCETKTSRQRPAASGQAILRVTVPDHRLDIGAGIIGQADLIEEIARIYGYERVPEVQMDDLLPPQRGNKDLDMEERVRDLLVDMGLQEVATYRLTSPEQQARLPEASAGPKAGDDAAYVRLANPIAPERSVMRRSILPGMLQVLAANARHQDRLALFEVGPVYLPRVGQALPDEPRRLAIALTGPREPMDWKGRDRTLMAFFDLKGVLEALEAALHLESAVAYQAAQEDVCLPGRASSLMLGEARLGWMGELHPDVRQAYDVLTEPAQAGQPVVVAELDLEVLLSAVGERHVVRPVPAFPPVKEDLAVVVDDAVPGASVQRLIQASGGDLLAEAALFDLYRGDQIGAGKKSLAFRLTYLAPDRTLTDAEVAKVRARIGKQLQQELGATLRTQGT